jgi:outer membrane murein-binding lipoprotein Lpp
MKKKAWLSALVVVASLYLSGCASTSTSPTLITASEVKAAKTKADHLALAAKYEALAREMQAKADEHKKLLTAETKRPYEVGRNVEDAEGHNQVLADSYQKAADFNLKMSQIEKDIASETR